MQKMVTKGTKKTNPSNGKAATADSKSSDKAVVSTSAQPETDTIQTAPPWPRNDLLAFNNARSLPVTCKADIKKLSSYNNRKYNDAWSQYHSIFYNGLLRMNFKPTKFICDATTQKMGILQDAKQMWANMGLGDLGYTPEPIYQELVIQFLSSVVLLLRMRLLKLLVKEHSLFSQVVCFMRCLFMSCVPYLDSRLNMKIALSPSFQVPFCCGKKSISLIFFLGKRRLR